MKNTPNKFNIIIPKKGTVSSASVKSKQDILENLKSISSEDIENVGEEINSGIETSNKASEVREAKKIGENVEHEEKCSEEHLMSARELILRLGIKLVEWEPIEYIDGKPIFIGTRGEKFLVFHDYDCIGDNIDGILAMKDEETNKKVAVLNIKGRPTLLTRMGYEDIIIWGKDQIDAGIFFRNHNEQDYYTVQEITNFLEGMTIS